MENAAGEHGARPCDSVHADTLTAARDRMNILDEEAHALLDRVDEEAGGREDQAEDDARQRASRAAAGQGRRARDPAAADAEGQVEPFLGLAQSRDDPGDRREGDEHGARAEEARGAVLDGGAGAAKRDGVVDADEVQEPGDQAGIAALDVDDGLGALVHGELLQYDVAHWRFRSAVAGDSASTDCPEASRQG